VRIAIADERAKVRFALRVLLQQQAGLEIVGEAANAQELIGQAEKDCTDAILLDCELPGMGLADLVEKLRALCPQVALIALSGRVDARRAAQSAGVDAFVSKGDPPERLLGAIQGCAEQCSGK
jgi:DNA-binding NarL/FixJ family response regulator